MKNAQNKTVFIVASPAAIVDNAAVACNVIDTKGYDYCDVEVIIGATDIATVALKVQESETKSNTTALTSGADVTGLVYGTSNNIAGSASSLPSSTADNKVYAFEIDLKGRARYLLPVLTGGDGTAGSYYSIVAHLYQAENQPTSAADRGYGDILRV